MAVQTSSIPFIGSPPCPPDLISMDAKSHAQSDPFSLVNGVSGNFHADWVVQKFGGTSVGKFCLNIIDKIIMWVFSTEMSLRPSG